MFLIFLGLFAAYVIFTALQGCSLVSHSWPELEQWEIDELEAMFRRS